MAVETASNYLTASSTASVYLSQSSAASVYLSQSSAASTYTTKANNLSDLANLGTARTNLGVAYATDAQVIAGTSASTVMTPAGGKVFALNLQVKDFTNKVFSFSGTGGGGVLNLNNSRDFFDINAGAVTTSGAYVFLNQPIEGLYNSTTTSIDWGKPFEIRGRLSPQSGIQTSSNAVWRLYIGATVSTAILGDPSVKSVGIKNAGGGQVQLMVHNGTSLFTVNTGFSQTSNQWFDFILSIDGAGNATLTINGTNTATSANAPTGTATTGNRLYIITENIGTITGANRLYGTNIKGIFNA